MRTRITILLCAMLICSVVQAATVIDPSDSNIQYIGRWDISNPSAPWAWTISSTIIANFQGTSIAADITKSASAEYIRVIIDDDAANSVKILVPTGMTTLASGLSDTTHKIEIVKETNEGRITLNGFELDDGKALSSPPPRKTRRIEFYGDSGVAGDSLEHERNDQSVQYRGTHYGWAGITSRMFDAEYINFSRSGATSTHIIYYHDQIDWTESTPLWDFNRFVPDVVVINVGANDKGPASRLRDRYHEILDLMRSYHPDAHVVLYNSYGWSTSEPANFIHEVIAEHGDSNMSSAVYPWVFAQWHPCEYDHGGIAMYIADHITSILGWLQNPSDVLVGFGRDGDVANGSFEGVAPFGGWAWRYMDDVGVSRVYDPAGAQDGDYYLSLSNGATSQQTNPASDGDVIYVSAWLRGANNGDQADITIDFRHQGQGGREQNAMISFSETKTLTTTWQQYTMTATAPTDMNPVYGNRVTFTAAAGDTIHVDDIYKSVNGGGSSCGDATCDPGEDQCNCAADCGSPPATETNCTDGLDEDCDTFTDCDDSDCDGDPACPSCGDLTCDPGEDQCNCPGDCGTPPATESNCTDGIDEDCDGGADCADPTGDCDTDPACQSACNDNGICEPGEDCNNCSGDCDSKTNGQPSGRYCCGDGEQTGPEGDGRCDGNY